MSEGRPKPAIPAWQRAAPPRPTATEDPVYSQHEKSQTEESSTTEMNKANNREPGATNTDENAPSSAPNTDTAGSQLNAFDSADFDEFKERQHQQQQQHQSVVQQESSQQFVQKQAAPPIITYPEFLIDAHKPPPLVTPTGVLNAFYVAGGIAAVLYGASKWIINPMVDNLSESRHDFLGHSQTKVDEFNERLSKIVSKVPDSKKSMQVQEQGHEDTDSVISDPTELYHRDMGTQTSPVHSRRSSSADIAKPEGDTPSAHAEALQSLCDKVKELTQGAEKTVEASKDRQENMNKLRHYLDGMIYGNAGALWQTGDAALSMKSDAASKDDSIEELKREIRSVKGVLLSAKRFPAVNRPVAGSG